MARGEGEVGFGLMTLWYLERQHRRGVGAPPSIVIHNYSILVGGCENTGWPASSYDDSVFYYSAVLEEIEPAVDG